MPFVPQTITVTAATTLAEDNHADTLVCINSTTGRIMTLPTSTGSGRKYTFFVQATVSSGNHVIAVANATDIIQGGVAISTDIAGVTCLATATDDTITMNGSTQGGVKGSWVRLTDAVSGIYMCEGFLVSTGSEATPFSAAVS